MKIVIDARFVGPKQTGLGRYTEELLKGLEQIDKKNKYIVLLRKEAMDYYIPQAENFKTHEADFPWYTISEQVKLPHLLKKLNPDLVHFCHFNVPFGWRRPFVVTIHDLIKDEFKGKDSTTRSAFVYSMKHYAYRAVTKHALFNSKFVLTPSNGSKQKIVERYNVPDKKVFVTYEAADSRFALYKDLTLSEKDYDHLLRKYKIKPPFLLYVGNAYPYKNLDRLLKAFSKIDKNVSLVNPCARNIFYDKLAANAKSKGLEDRVVLPGFVPDEDLALLYKAAELYVFPSLSEGFGLPLLEAQMAGLPVVSSSAPPLPEVGGKGAAYFDPNDIEDMAKQINLVLKDEDLKNELISLGQKNVERFSWVDTAKKTLAAYNKAFND